MATVVQKYAAATAVRSTYNSVYNTSAKGTPAPVASGQAVTYNRPQTTQTATYNSRGATVPPVSTASAGSQAGTVVVKVSGTTTSRCTTPAVVATSTRVTTTGTTGNTNRVGTPAVVATNSVKTTTTGTTATRITTPAVTVSTTRVTTTGSIGNTNRVGTPAVVATGNFQRIDFGNRYLYFMTPAVQTGISGSGITGFEMNVLSQTAYWEGREIDFSKINSMLTPFPTAPTTVETVQVQEEKKNGWLHNALDAIGFIPVFGEVADALNAVVYAIEGDWLNAGISAATLLPGLEGATATRTTLNAAIGTTGFLFLREAGEEVAEKVGKETAENITEAAIKGGTDVIQSKFNKLLNSDYYKTDFGYDCSEIAQDFYDAAGQQGKIYRIEGKSGYINGYEYNNQVEYIYHEVYSDGTYIYDPRYTNVPVLKDDYFRALREINPDGFDVFEIME